ncbi:hypothetical protein H4S03_008801, partial [Coemansia sp. S3946]
MSYNNNYGQQYNDQGGSYGQQYGGQQYDNQYDNQYGAPHQPNVQYGDNQYDNQYGAPQPGAPYDNQYGGQQSYGDNQYNEQYGGKQKPQAFDFDIDFDKVTDASTEQVARMLLGQNQYANELTGLQISTNSARDLQDFDMKDLEESSRDITERGIFDGFGGNGKSKKSHQLLGGAAAWAALNWYQTKSRNQGKKVSHGFAKKLMVAFAAAQAIKYWEKNSKSFQNGVSRDLVIAEATRSASLAADISA